MSNKPLKISEQAAVQMPMKTVASLIAMVAIGTWAYFGINEKLNHGGLKRTHPMQLCEGFADAIVRAYRPRKTPEGHVACCAKRLIRRGREIFLGE